MLVLIPFILTREDIDTQNDTKPNDYYSFISISLDEEGVLLTRSLSLLPSSHPAFEGNLSITRRAHKKGHKKMIWFLLVWFRV